MKENYKIKNKGLMMIVLIAIVLSLGSCQKYLDIKKTGIQKFIETATDCQLLLDTYEFMNTNYPSDGQASSDDYYIGSAAFPGVIDQEYQNIYTWNANAIHANALVQWTNTYKTVYYANLVLDALTKDKVKSSADAATMNNLKGSALFYRAYALWNIAQLYTKPYSSTADQDPGIPARTSSDLNDVFGRGTVKETYNRIIQDLQDAIGLLNFYNVPTPVSGPGLASRPNKAAAYAMLARVYLSMEDYPQALTNANASLQLYPTLINYNDMDQNSGSPFPQFNNEVLFQSTMYGPGDPDQANLNLLSPFDRDGNPQAVVNTALYASYEDNDLRKIIFFKPNSDGTYWFTGNYDGTTNNKTLFNGLTVDEMYLTRAECYVRAGNIGSAMADLNTLLVTRWKGKGDASTYVNQTADSADAALSKILDERRKELVMRGQRWTDLRRLNKDNKYKINLSRPGTTYTLPANDPRYVLLISQEVINKANMAQNPR